MKKWKRSRHPTGVLLAFSRSPATAVRGRPEVRKTWRKYSAVLRLTVWSRWQWPCRCLTRTQMSQETQPFVEVLLLPQLGHRYSTEWLGLREPVGPPCCHLVAHTTGLNCFGATLSGMEPAHHGSTTTHNVRCTVYTMAQPFVTTPTVGSGFLLLL